MAPSRTSSANSSEAIQEVQTASYGEGTGLSHFLRDLESPQRAQACAQFRNIMSEEVPDHPDREWVAIIDALIQSNCVDSIRLARDILAGKFSFTQAPWSSQRGELRNTLSHIGSKEPVWEFEFTKSATKCRCTKRQKSSDRSSGKRSGKAKTEADKQCAHCRANAAGSGAGSKSAKAKKAKIKAHMEEIALHEITDAYKELATHLVDQVDAKDLCAGFWTALFKHPNSVYFGKLVNSFNQHKYIGDADEDARMSFLDALANFLDKSSEQNALKDHRCWPDLNSAIGDSLKIAIEDVERHNGPGEKVGGILAKMVKTCSGMPLGHGHSLSPYGTVAMTILESLGESNCEAYKLKLLSENVEELLEWADTKGCKDGYGPGGGNENIGRLAREAIFEQCAQYHPELLSTHGKALVRLYKSSRCGVVIGGLASAYLHIAPDVNREFEMFFNDLFEFRGFPRGYYELLESISSKEPTLFTGGHVGRLVSRMGQHEEDVPYILDVILSITKNNTPIMESRGAMYYKIGVCSAADDEDKMLDNLEKTNDIMVWMALANESEAERIVTLMIAAFQENDCLKNASAINSLLISWQKIAQIYKSPFVTPKRTELIDGWEEKTGTKEEAESLKRCLSGSTACILM